MSSRPVALVTGEVSPYRREPFALLGEAEGVEVLTWGGSAGGSLGGDAPVRAVTQAGAARLIASGRYRAAIVGLGGRMALPASYLAARRARIPFVLWTSLWEHPRSPAHAVSYLPTRHLYRHADAVVTYGPHVSRYVERHRRAGRVFDAPQACAAELRLPAGEAERAAWRERTGAGEAGFLALFAGRLVREKGVEPLLEGWRRSELGSGGGVLAVVGTGPLRPAVDAGGPGVLPLGSLGAADLTALYAAADVLVVPSIRTATFTEPWGLVANEAMHQGTPVLATDAVGAAAGGLVRDGRNGLTVAEGDADALAARLRILALDRELGARLGGAALEDVAAYTPAAWVGAVRAAQRAVGVAAGGNG